MQAEIKCPKCQSENIYQDGRLWICPECSHEWSPSSSTQLIEEPISSGVRDAHGNILVDGDNVSVIKDLKLKGSSSVVKNGTKAKNIRVNEFGDDGHNISCRIETFGTINLKSEFVKKI
jgi:protein PhnA